MSEARPRLLATTVALALAPTTCADQPRSSDPAPWRETRAHGLHAELTARGVTVGPTSGAPWRFVAAPLGFGCDGELGDLGGAEPEEHAGRFEYARPELLEWYREVPRGLEQGFTIPAPPACRRRGQSGVVIALGGGLRADVSAGGRAARLRDGSGHPVLRYTDLHVVDAAGRELPARLEARGDALAIRFDDAGARYPVEVDPLMWVEQQQLVGDGSSTFGQAVALNGNTIIVGAADVMAPGSATVFVRAGGTWSEQQVLAQAGTTQLGRAVAVSGDTALVGAVVVPNPIMGAAFFFTRTGTSWAETQELTEPDTSFGASVALDGDTAVIGAPDAMPAAAYDVARAGTTWSVQQVLGGSAAPDGFGLSVALSGDTLVVGAPSGANGSASVFTRAGTTWTLQQQLTASDGSPGDVFGASVALVGDTALVGAPNRAGGEGATYVFARSGVAWTQQAELTGSVPTAGVGTAVALTAGSAAVADVDFGGDAREVDVYTLSGAIPTLQQSLTVGNSAGNGAGGGVAGFGAASLALDGATLVAGLAGDPHSPGPTGPTGSPGKAFVYSIGAPAGAPCTVSTACFSGSCVDGRLRLARSPPARPPALAAPPGPASRGRACARRRRSTKARLAARGSSA